MILINGEQKKDLEKLTKPVKFRLASKYVSTFITTGERQAYTRALSVAIPCVYNMVDPKIGSVQVRYATSSTPRQVGSSMVMDYAPVRITFTEEELIVYPEQPDLYYFLMNSPYLDNKYYLDNAAELAKQRVFNERKVARAKDMIIGVNGLDRDEQRELYRKLGYAYSESMSDFEIEDTLLSTAQTHPEKIIDGNKARIGEIKVRTELAIQNGIVVHDTKRRKWILNSEDGALDICGIAIGQDPKVVLVEFFKHKDDANIYGIVEKKVKNWKDEPVN